VGAKVLCYIMGKVSCLVKFRGRELVVFAVGIFY